MTAAPKPPKLKLPRGWRVKPVTPRMHKKCAACSRVPVGARVIHTQDAAPFPVVTIYCRDCAVEQMRAWAKSISDQVDAVALAWASNNKPGTKQC
jgi:hypothetical protein